MEQLAAFLFEGFLKNFRFSVMKKTQDSFLSAIHQEALY